MPDRLVGKRSVVKQFKDPVLAWELIPGGFNITVKAWKDILCKFSDHEEKMMSELLRRGGTCTQDVAYLGMLEPCEEAKASGKDLSGLSWGSPWIPPHSKQGKFSGSFSQDALEAQTR